MNNSLVTTKLLVILLLLAFCTPVAQASKEEINRANLGLVVSKQFGAITLLVPNGEMHKVKNKKGQVRRVFTRRAQDEKV